MAGVVIASAVMVEDAIVAATAVVVDTAAAMLAAAVTCAAVAAVIWVAVAVMRVAVAVMLVAVAVMLVAAAVMLVAAAVMLVAVVAVVAKSTGRESARGGAYQLRRFLVGLFPALSPNGLPPRRAKRFCPRNFLNPFVSTPSVQLGFAMCILLDIAGFSPSGLRHPIWATMRFMHRAGTAAPEREVPYARI
jgi:hypothetical protein